MVRSRKILFFMFCCFLCFDDAYGMRDEYRNREKLPSISTRPSGFNSNRASARSGGDTNRSHIQCNYRKNQERWMTIRSRVNSGQMSSPNSPFTPRNCPKYRSNYYHRNQKNRFKKRKKIEKKENITRYFEALAEWVNSDKMKDWGCKAEVRGNFFFATFSRKGTSSLWLRKRLHQKALMFAFWILGVWGNYYGFKQPFGIGVELDAHYGLASDLVGFTVTISEIIKCNAKIDMMEFIQKRSLDNPQKCMRNKGFYQVCASSCIPIVVPAYVYRDLLPEMREFLKGGLQKQHNYCAGHCRDMNDKNRRTYFLFFDQIHTFYEKMCKKSRRG